MLSNVKMVIYFRYDQILETALLKALSRKSSKSYGQDKLPTYPKKVVGLKWLENIKSTLYATNNRKLAHK